MDKPTVNNSNRVSFRLPDEIFQIVDNVARFLQESPSVACKLIVADYFMCSDSGPLADWLKFQYEDKPKDNCVVPYPDDTELAGGAQWKMLH